MSFDSIRIKKLDFIQHKYSVYLMFITWNEKKTVNFNENTVVTLTTSLIVIFTYNFLVKVQKNSPIPKFLGLFSNNGFTSFFCSTFLTARGAAATFLPTFFLGCIKKGKKTDILHF